LDAQYREIGLVGQSEKLVKPGVKSLLSFAKGYGEFHHPLWGCTAPHSGEASLLPCFGIKPRFFQFR